MVSFVLCFVTVQKVKQKSFHVPSCSVLYLLHTVFILPAHLSVTGPTSDPGTVPYAEDAKPLPAFISWQLWANDATVKEKVKEVLTNHRRHSEAVQGP